MKIGFDYDGVLFNEPPGFSTVVKALKDNEVFVLTTRDKITDRMRARARELFGFVPTMIAIGRYIDSNRYKYKADYLVDNDRIPDLFFDDDIFEIRRFYSIDIPAILVTPMRNGYNAMSYVFTTLMQQEFFTKFD